MQICWFKLDRASLSDPHSSVTALHIIMYVYIHVHICLFVWTSYVPMVKLIQNKRNDPHQCVLQLSCEDEHEGLLPDCSIGMKEARVKIIQFECVNWQHTW